jgi:hypothetical protein
MCTGLKFFGEKMPKKQVNLWFVVWFPVQNQTVFIGLGLESLQ